MTARPTVEAELYWTKVHYAQALEVKVVKLTAQRDELIKALGELMDRAAVLAVLEDNQRQGYLKLLNALNREPKDEGPIEGKALQSDSGRIA